MQKTENKYMVSVVSVQKQKKKYKFEVRKLYVDEDELGVIIKRVARGNKLYIYVYQRGLLRNYLFVSLKVIVYERE